MVTAPDPEADPISLITGCLSVVSSPLRFDQLSAANWEEMVVTAISLGLAPLLHWQLSRAGVNPPPLALAKLAVTRQAHDRRNREIARQVSEILAACTKEKIDVLALKGALLAATAYPDPALRPMNDIDLLFRPEALDRVGLLLEHLGYQGKHKTADQGPGITKHLSTYRRPGNAGVTPNPYLSAGGDRTVEPHGCLEESWFGLKVDVTPGVWERAVPISLYDQPAYRLSAADMLLHLAVHAAFHVMMGASIFVQLYDLGRVIDTWTAELDWNCLLGLARSARAEPFAYAGLFWAARVYGATVPEAVLAELDRACPPQLAAHIRSLDAPGLLARTQQPPLVTLRQRLWRGLSDRREAARWADSPGGKWQVWKTALAFYKTDTVQLVRAKLQ